MGLTHMQNRCNIEHLLGLNNRLCHLTEEEVRKLAESAFEAKAEGVRTVMLCDFIEACIEEFDKRVNYLEFWPFLHRWVVENAGKYDLDLLRRVRDYRYKI